MRTPGFVFMSILEIAVVAILMFGVEVALSDGVPIEVVIFRTRVDTHALVTSRLIPSLSALAGAGLIGIFIIGFSGTYLDLLEDPLLPVYLAGGAGRSRLLVIRALSILVSFAVQLCAFGVALGATLSTKMGHCLFSAPMAGVASLLIGFTVALSFAAVVSMIVPDRTAVIVSSLLIYFGVAPALENMSMALHPVLGGLRYIVPPGGELSDMAQEALGGDGLRLKIFLQAFAASVSYLIVATLLFRWKDL